MIRNRKKKRHEYLDWDKALEDSEVLEDEGELGQRAPLLDERERNDVVRAMMMGNETQGIGEFSDADMESVLLWANETRSRAAKLDRVLNGRLHLISDHDGDPSKVRFVRNPYA